MRAPQASRTPVIFSILFLFAVLALGAFLTSRQMDALHDGVPTVERTGLVICGIGVILGLAGLAWAWASRANSNRRAALLAFGFGTIVLLVQIYNLATQ